MESTSRRRYREATVQTGFILGEKENDKIRRWTEFCPPCSGYQLPAPGPKRRSLLGSTFSVPAVEPVPLRLEKIVSFT